MIAALLAFLAAQERVADARRCAECHEEQRDLWKDSVHAAKGTDCVGCHGADQIDTRKSRPHLYVQGFRRGVLKELDEAGRPRSDSPALCGTCHIQELEEFKRSQHYADWEEGGKVRGCLACHAEHRTAPARREEILKSKEHGCAECHRPTSRQIAVMTRFGEQMAALEPELARLEACLAEEEPGISWAAERAALEAARRARGEFRSRQHAGLFSVFKKLEEEIPAAARAAREAFDRAEQRKAEFARRKALGLGGFLALMALNLVLARAWCRRRFGGP
jgi:formate-dependent nitrite reductase cytochrome c552 subunit